MVDWSSKHFGSLVIQRKKSISVGVASTEIFSFIPFTVNGTNPVDILVWWVKASVSFFSLQLSCWAEAKTGIRNKRAQIVFIIINLF
jgi:hypothetical protein